MIGPVKPLDEGALRVLVPRVLAGLVRRGEDFDAAEDALQEALLEALRVWPEHPPHDPRAWLTTVATRRLVDARRSESARHRREETTYAEPRPATTEEGDDTLFLLFCCCHPDLAPASQGGAECGDEPIIVSQCVAVPGLRDHRVPELRFRHLSWRRRRLRLIGLRSFMRVGLRPVLIRMIWPATIPGTVVYEFEADYGV